MLKYYIFKIIWNSFTTQNRLFLHFFNASRTARRNLDFNIKASKQEFWPLFVENSRKFFCIFNCTKLSAYFESVLQKKKFIQNTSNYSRKLQLILYCISFVLKWFFGNAKKRKLYWETFTINIWFYARKKFKDELTLVKVYFVMK